MNKLEQQIAEQELKLAKLREIEKVKNASTSILIGSMYLSLAKSYPEYAKRVLIDLETNITKKSELARLKDLMEELEKIAYPNGRLQIENWDGRTQFLRR